MASKLKIAMEDCCDICEFSELLQQDEYFSESEIRDYFENFWKNLEVIDDQVIESLFKLLSEHKDSPKWFKILYETGACKFIFETYGSDKYTDSERCKIVDAIWNYISTDFTREYQNKKRLDIKSLITSVYLAGDLVENHSGKLGEYGGLLRLVNPKYFDYFISGFFAKWCYYSEMFLSPKEASLYDNVKTSANYSMLDLFNVLFSLRGNKWEKNISIGNVSVYKSDDNDMMLHAVTEKCDMVTIDTGNIFIYGATFWDYGSGTSVKIITDLYKPRDKEDRQEMVDMLVDFAEKIHEKCGK